MINIENTILKLNNFPTLPSVYHSLSSALSDPHSSNQTIADIISKDPVSVGKILKFVNSALYSLRYEIDTLSQAIFMLGFNEIKNLVLALSVTKLFEGVQDQHSFNMAEFWKHSIAVAVITKLLGLNLGVKNVENYFISGLMHDIGKLVFFKLYPEDFNKAIDYALENKTFLRNGELEIFGIDHSTAGNLLAERWKLPLTIRNCISCHHQGLIDGKVDQLTACVHLGNIIANMLELGVSGDHLVDKPNNLIWPELNFKEYTFRDLYSEIIVQYEHSYSIFKLD